MPHVDQHPIGGMKVKRAASVTIGLVMVFGVMGSPSSSAVESKSSSTIWSRSDEAPALSAVGSIYWDTALQGGLLPSSDSPSAPIQPTPENQKKAIQKGGDSYKTTLGEANNTSLVKSDGVVDFATCDADLAGHQANGHVLNHFSFCRWGYNTATKLDGQGRIEGQVRFRETEVGDGSKTARTGRVYVKVTEVTSTGIFAAGTGATMRMAVSASGYPGSCSASFGTTSVYQEPVATWNDTFVFYEVTSPSTSGDQTRIDKVASCSFHSGYKVDSAKGATDYSSGPAGGMRMDSAAYLAPYGTEGTIFNYALPSLLYDYNNKELGRVAEHIFYTFRNPDGTDPWISTPKIIPGEYIVGKMLHRNYPKFNAASDEISKNNLSAKNTACASVVKGNSTYECDEFPFASTKEGAGLGDRNFSVRYLPQPDNSKAGGALSKWYGEDRILDGDEYWVQVDNHLKLVPGAATSQHSGLVLDAVSNRNGAALQVWAPWGGANQKFYVNDDGEVRVYGNCIDADSGAQGTLLTAKACNGGPSQKWGPHLTYKGAIVHTQSGLCMDVKDWGTQNGTLVMLYTCTGNPNQLWSNS
ncbi:ricin-type beta-trefoil lectin domain protein [Streptomyces sp. NPDC054961]